MYENATSISTSIVNNVFYLFLAICFALLFLVTFFMIFFLIRYRRRRNPHPVDIKSNVFLETIWSVGPTILVLFMFYYSWNAFKVMDSVGKNAMNVKVTARQWSWLFEYDNGKQGDILRVPVSTPVKLRLHSEDVIHSLFIPAFRIKQDVVPGMETELVFTPEKTGTFDGFCAVYCGVGHSSMLTKVVVMPKEKFREWYEGAKAEEKGESKGKSLFMSKGCVACHSIDGSKRIGPTLKGVFGKRVKVITKGKERDILADEAYLERSILEPSADVVKGFQPIMPSFKNRITEKEMGEIIEYLKSLK